MKKIFFSFSLLFLVTLTSNGQKFTVDHFEVDKTGMATVFLVNENNETKTVNIRTIINPNANGRNGRLTGRQGLLLTPMIRPETWEEGEVQGFFYNIGFEPGYATVYIIEGSWNLEGNKLDYTGREETVECNTGNPAGWTGKYKVGEYQIPNFMQSVTVSKDGDRYLGKF